jgi:hypothetical protein
MRKVVATMLTLFSISFLLPATPASAADGPALLTACVNAINDPLYTRATLPGLMSVANTATLETLITNGTIVVWVANGAGEISGSASSNGNGRDIFCGDSNDNTIQTMDSDSSSRDYFFGGAGMTQSQEVPGPQHFMAVLEMTMHLSWMKVRFSMADQVQIPLERLCRGRL